MQAKINEAWKSMYRFDLQPQHSTDYEVANWYLSNHPESHFVTGLRAARAAPGRRYGLLQNELAIHEIGAETTRRTLATPSQLQEALETIIGIRLPEHPALADTLTRIARAAPAHR
jgi:N-hydroxyarylamine O-acetyltransferase